MQIKVFLHSYLKKYIKDNNNYDYLIIPDGSTLEKLIEHYNLRKDEIGVVVIDNKLGDFNTKIHEDSEIHLYPIFEGG